MRRFLRISIYIGLFFFTLLIASNIWVVTSTKDKIYFDRKSLPSNDVALVLGTSHKTVAGKPNPFFEKRIETAHELFVEGKVKHFIVSGDNRSIYYNEPLRMQMALIKKGVPSSAITLDYAGLRTLDSIIRCKEIFGQDKITVITQSFHSYRAVFISNYYDINAVAMVAAEPDFDETPGVRIREYFARSKAIMDLYLLGTTPRFMGQKEDLNIGN
jgi:SanA protein